MAMSSCWAWVRVARRRDLAAACWAGVARPLVSWVSARVASDKGAGDEVTGDDAPGRGVVGGDGAEAGNGSVEIERVEVGSG